MKANHIYIGPSLPWLGLKQGTLYLTGDLPPQLRSLVDLNPKLSVLYVPTSKLGDAKVSMTKAGTIEHAAATDMMQIPRPK